MKRIISIISSLLFLVCFSSCGVKNEITNTVSNSIPSKNENEIEVHVEQYQDSEDTSTETKPVITIEAQYANPDLELDVFMSDTIVLGEVVEELGEEHSNPDGSLLNEFGDPVPCAMVTTYKFHVEKVYKGSVEPNQDIIIASANDVFVPLDEMENYDFDLDTTYLDEGQRGIFFLVNDRTRIGASDEDMLFLRNDDCIFSENDSDGLYYSPTYKLDPSDFPTLIEQANEKWADIFDSYSKNPI